MISVYNLKSRFQKLLKPVLVMLHGFGVTANMITWSAILLSLGAGVAFWIHPNGRMLLVIPAVFLVRMALNALDGMMAVTYKTQSKLGEVLNELGDVFSDLFLFLPLLQMNFLNTYTVLAFLFLAVINEFAGILGKAVSGQRRYEGPMGKSDRVLLVGLFCIGVYFWQSISAYGNYVLIVACGLMILSTFIRLRKSVH